MKRFLASALALLLGMGDLQAATLLPPGRQVFLNTDGTPLINGFVYFYQQGSQTVPKTTWLDAAQTQPNPNPVVLDSMGAATIYGSGTYQEVVTDMNGNVIWNQPTADTSYLSNTWLWGGTSTGSANAQVISIPGFSSATGQLVSFIAGFTNTSALSVNGFNVVKDGTSGPSSLSGGEVVQGNSVSLVFDPTLQNFHMVEPSTYPPLWGGGVSLVASGTTTDLCLNAPSALVKVTGATTITSFGASCTVGQMKMVQFQAPLTLTSSGNLIVPGGSLTVAAGQWIIAAYSATNTWSLIDPSIKHSPSVFVWGIAGSGTYNTPSWATRLEIEMCGGGGGGGGGGNILTGGQGSAGGNTTFGPDLTAAGGNASQATGTTVLPFASVATGGDANEDGGVGQASMSNNTNANWMAGGQGAPSVYGSGGIGAVVQQGGVTIPAQTGFVNCAGGGGGTMNTNGYTTGSIGAGGNSGAYLRKTILNPAATYSWTVGAAGAGGAAGTGGTVGAGGQPGSLIVKAY